VKPRLWQVIPLVAAGVVLLAWSARPLAPSAGGPWTEVEVHFEVKPLPIVPRIALREAGAFRLFDAPELVWADGHLAEVHPPAATLAWPEVQLLAIEAPAFRLRWEAAVTRADGDAAVVVFNAETQAVRVLAPEENVADWQIELRGVGPQGLVIYDRRSEQAYTLPQGRSVRTSRRRVTLQTPHGPLTLTPGELASVGDWEVALDAATETDATLRWNHDGQTATQTLSLAPPAAGADR